MNLLLRRVRPGLRSRVKHALVASAFVAGAALIARTAGLTLLLSSRGAEVLPIAYLLTSLVLLIGTALLSRFMRRTRVDRVLIYACIVIVLLCIGVRVGLEFARETFIFAAYLVADLIAKLLVGAFWALSALLFDVREARRVQGLLGAGATGACLVAGLAIAPLATLAGPDNLFLVAAVLVAGMGLTILRLSRVDGGAVRRFAAGRASPHVVRSASQVAELARTPLVRRLGLLVGVSTIALFFVDYAFMTSVRALHADESLAAYLGVFFAAAALVGLALQLLLVERTLARGVFFALMVLPVGLGVMSLGAAVTGAHPWLVGAKFLEPVLFFTIDAAAIQVLYHGIRKTIRGPARALANGLFRPVAVAAAALLLVSLGAIEVRIMAAIVPIVCIAWMVCAWACARGYVQGLAVSLGAHCADGSEIRQGMRAKRFLQHLRRFVLSAPDEQLPYLLDLIPAGAGSDWNPEHRALLVREPVVVKVKALDWLGEHGSPEDLDAVLAELTSSSPDVRRAALRALARLGGAASASTLEQAMLDADPQVRASASALLLDVGDFKGLVAGCKALEDLLSSESVAERAAGVSALGFVERVGVTQGIGLLLNDPDRGVRRTAIEAGSRTRSPEFAAAILPLLGEPELRPAAADALIAIGRAHPEHVASLVARAPIRAEDGAGWIAHVLAHLGPVGHRHLEARLSADNPSARNHAAWAFSRALRDGIAVQVKPAVLEARLRRELGEAAEMRATCARAADLPRNEALLAAFREEVNQRCETALLVLGLSRPDVDMAEVLDDLRGASPTGRTQALELIDNLAPASARQELVRHIEEPAALGASHPDDAPALAEIVADPASSEWLVAASVHSLGQRGEQAEWVHAERLLQHPSSTVRETALAALAELAEPHAVAAACENLATDASASVRRVAGDIANRIRNNDRGTCQMINLERMNRLRRVPIFESLHARDLRQLAAIATEVTHAAGETIFAEGDVGDGLYVVIDGAVRIHLGDSTLDEVAEARHFGEMSLVDGAPRSATATATRDCHLLFIGREDFLTVLSRHPEVARELIRILSLRVRGLMSGDEDGKLPIETMV